MVQKDHPCIALPCVCILSMGIGIILTLLMGLFTTQAGYIAANLILGLAGVWFITLSGVWYKRSDPSIVWVIFAALFGWLLFTAGLIGAMPAGSAMYVGAVIGLFVFGISMLIIDVEQGTLIPVPYPKCGGRYNDDTEYPTEYPSREVGYNYDPPISSKSSTPRFWGSWKGQVILAIAEARTPLTFEEILSRTKLHSSAVATAILELLKIGVLRYENDETHTVEPGLYYEYRDYIENNQKRTADYAPPVPMPQMSDGRKHRTNNGEMVRSKSEVIVANTLARLGLYYEYEKTLENPKDRNDSIRPDFTIHHGGKVFYWEHLGMLQKPSYKASWEWKINWYRKCEYEVITSRDGDDGSIDAQNIEAIARNRILHSN